MYIKNNIVVFFTNSCRFYLKTKQKQKVNADRQENDYILVSIWISYLLRTLVSDSLNIHIH